MKKLTIILICSLLTIHISAQIIHVPADYPTIQAAIDTAYDLDTILVAPGTYVENINFNGKNITLASHFLTTQDTSYISQTIIDGNENGAVVMFNSGEESTALLSGFTITNGSYSGIYCNHSEPRLQNLIITNNIGDEGGGIHIHDKNVQILNCILENNSSTSKGGGIYIEEDSFVEIDNSKIINNHCEDGGGGGIASSYATVNLNNCDVLYNSSNRGGGIYSSQSSFDMNNCEVSYNTSSSHGGGIYEYWDTDFVIYNSSICHNTSLGHGGGISLRHNSTLFMDNVMISDNQASYEGGGLYIDDTDPSLKNVSITHNKSAERGGGICFRYSGEPTFHESARSNIYLNEAPVGADLWGWSSEPLNVIVDTFSVLEPNGVFVYPLYAYTFDILHGKIDQVEADLYVSPEGDNNNSGLTADDPLKTIRYATMKMKADSLNPYSIYLLDGTYKTSGNGEIFPVILIDHFTITGTGMHDVILDAEQQHKVLSAYQTKGVSVKNMTVTGGQYSSGGGITIYDCNPIMENLIFVDNHADSEYGYSSGGAINMSRSSPTLENVIINGNTSGYQGGGISMWTESFPRFKNVTIKNNTSGQGGGISLASDCYIGFDTTDRCNIYDNMADYGSDLYWNNAPDSMLHVVVDTFSVLFPSDYYAEPLNAFTFDINYGANTQYDADLYVSPDGDNSNTGLTMDDPLKTIRYAYGKIIADSLHQNTIHLLEGTYSPSTNGELFPVTVMDYLSLEGVSEENVILDADSLSRVMDLTRNNSSRISNMTLTGGVHEIGAGIYLLEANTELTNLTITENHTETEGAGGGIYCDNSDPFLQNVIISNNSANSGFGGGIYCNDSDPLLHSVFISNNSANSGFGGGFYCDNSDPLMQNVIISDNSAASGNGGGIYCSSGSYPVFQNATVINNEAEEGGGIYVYKYAYPTIKNTSIKANKASYAGGGILFDHGAYSVQLDSLFIEENEAPYGGGIAAYSDSIRISNSLIKGNIATTNGGGIYDPYADITLSNITVAYNTAHEQGGGIFTETSQAVFDTINRCNIYLNTAYNHGNDIYRDGNPVLNIALDTFTVLKPTNYQAVLVNQFNFDIKYGMIEQEEADLYVSPDGDNTNSGLTPDEPLKNIWFAITKTWADSLHPHTILLQEGVYSPETDELFPILMTDHISINGASRDETILDAQEENEVIQYYLNNQAPSVSNVTITGADQYGIHCYKSSPVIDNVIVRSNKQAGIYCNKYAGPYY